MVFKPEFKCSRQTLPDVLVAILKRLRVVEDLLNISLSLSIWSKFLWSQIILLLVKHVEILSKLKVWLLPLVIPLRFDILVELLKNAWVSRIDLDL